MDALELYDKMKNTFTWDAIRRTDYFADYQNQYTFLGVLGQRQLYVTVANALIDIEEDEKALEIMDMLWENFPESQFPLESIPLGFSGNDLMVAQIIENYYFLGAADKARPLATRMGLALLDTAGFYLQWGSLGSKEFETASQVLLYIADVCKQYGDKELGDAMVDSLEAIIHEAAGTTPYQMEREEDSLKVSGS